MKLQDVVIRFGERYLSAPEIDEINSHVYVNIRNKRVTLFSLTMAPLVRAKDEISKLDQLCSGKSRSFRRTDGPIEDPRRLDRIGPFCGAVERPVLSVLSTFGHASVMSTGIAWTASGRLNSAPDREILTSLTPHALAPYLEPLSMYRFFNYKLPPWAPVDYHRVLRQRRRCPRLSRLTSTGGVWRPLCLSSRF